MNMTVLLPRQGSNTVACGGFRKLSVSTFLFPVVSAHHSFLSKATEQRLCYFYSSLGSLWLFITYVVCLDNNRYRKTMGSECLYKGMHYWVEILYFDAQLERTHN